METSATASGAENIDKMNDIKLGFGLMRLPQIDGNPDGLIDIEETKRMVDAFLEAGGKYFDTAFIYQGSEEATKEALCSRHPRSIYYLASKVNAAAWVVKNADDAKDELQKSLEKSGAGYFDYYLLHCIDSASLKLYDSYGMWDFVKEQKAAGLIRHWGFSFHDRADVLEQVLNEHPDAEFVQLQINYADWEDAVVQSRLCYETATRHNIPVIVMEPVKGGMLANPPQSVSDILKAADPVASSASWAIRFAASLPNVMMVLSGMSSMEQMIDNLSYMSHFKPLSKEESAVIAKAREALSAIDRIPCTACHYCSPGCPKGIHIPEVFAIMNEYKLYNNIYRARADYKWRPGGTRASACVGCGQCENSCPQHLPVMSLLAEAVKTLEERKVK